MQATIDTNVLIRLFVDDDPEQSRIAADALAASELVVIPLQTFCEFVWVLGRHYKVAREDISTAIRALLGTRNVVVNRPAVDAGLSMLDAGGDFADGVIDFEGRLLGGSTFITFDRKASELLAAQGRHSVLLS